MVSADQTTAKDFQKKGIRTFIRGMRRKRQLSASFSLFEQSRALREGIAAREKISKLAQLNPNISSLDNC